MNDRISKKQKWFTKIKLTCDDELYVGIDVHKKSYHVAFWLNAVPALDFVMPADNTKVLTILETLRIAIRMVVYEAGLVPKARYLDGSIHVKKKELLTFCHEHE